MEEATGRGGLTEKGLCRPWEGFFSASAESFLPSFLSHLHAHRVCSREARSGVRD